MAAKIPGWIKKFRKWLQPARRSGVANLSVGSRGVYHAAVAQLMAASPEQAVLLVAPDAGEAERLANGWESLREIAGDARRAVVLPEVGGRRQQWMPENESSRCAALQDILAGTPALYIASAAALLAPVVAPKEFAKRSFSLKVGQHIAPELLAERLVELDYDCEVEVTLPGEFARRGGIVDLFSPLYGDPVRVEFWGDEIDSMRFFSAATQCSTKQITEFKVIPRGGAVNRKEDDASKATDMVRLREYFPKDVTMILCDDREILRHLQEFSGEEAVAQWQEILDDDAKKVTIIPPALAENAPQTHLAGGCKSLDVEVPCRDFAMEMEAEALSGIALWHWQQLCQELLRWHAEGYEIVACCSSDGEIQRLQELLAAAVELADVPLQVEERELYSGLLIPECKLVLLGDKEIFGRNAIVRRRRAVDYRYCGHSAEDELAGLAKGTMMVHVNHGFCLYHGICFKSVDGELLEVIELEFADEKKLYLPVEFSNLLSPYMGGTKSMPSLSVIGSSAWSRSCAKASEAAMDLAAELLRLEAVRSAAPGIEYRPMPDWERAFAGSFPYNLTPDQQSAIKACMDDMASPKPMDRLLCGDVGYGKTEVAMRVAFRAVMNGRQVAVLVPTTVLAQQHYQSFTARMAEFPVRVEVLSRFRSARQQREIIAQAAAGNVDILIGTHRLISKDVRFANLGLLIIDEEQRFGVKHKQKLKAMRANLDILTMTATPIPRTLYFSLAGIRNLSTIMSPPENRLPVITVVANYDDATICSAILQEVSRGGQVFFLHNRVRSIGKFVERLQAMMPNVRFAVGHGQMKPEELEEIMRSFVAHDADVLLCTTIIESGIDIPNVNTIIIDRADRFGLAELYQLRGRVGRGFRQAYAYMLLPPMGALPENARQRMEAIKRFTHLGAGFRLAMRDLEIRGCGNILGQEQSGYIAAVGFDLYCKLLQDAVAKLENKPVARRLGMDMKLDVITSSLRSHTGQLSAAIPCEFITDESSRLQIYRRLQRSATEEEVDSLQKELSDRYGVLPPLLENLLLQYRIRALALQRGVFRLWLNQRQLVVETGRGILKIKGAVPTLKAENPLEQLQELLDILRAMPKAFA